MRIDATVPVDVPVDDVRAVLARPDRWAGLPWVARVEPHGGEWDVELAFEGPHPVELVLRVVADDAGARLVLVRGAAAALSGEVSATEHGIRWVLDLRFPASVPSPLARELAASGPPAWSSAIAALAQRPAAEASARR